MKGNVNRGAAPATAEGLILLKWDKMYARKLFMRGTAACVIFLCTFTLAMWALNNAAAQNERDSSVFSGIVLKPSCSTYRLVVLSVSDNHINWAGWIIPTDETHFKIWRAVFSGALYLLTEVGPNVTAYTIRGSSQERPLVSGLRPATATAAQIPTPCRRHFGDSDVMCS